MGYTKRYVQEALLHCGPGDVATALAILNSWAAQEAAVRERGEHL